uniref:Uncharacterized protein n=1 Tax=Leptosiphonia brodiei TaxID=2608611 RepID=A0A1Z1MAP4_9FLOR|nr:hypothetical protein [Leptosiphonia brodiei]ARW62885.1 hypothetical protein [Leptosiphonia brodiei]
MNNNDFFLRYIKGKWFLQENFLLLNNKRQLKQKTSINFHVNHKAYFNKKQIVNSAQNGYNIIKFNNRDNNYRRYLNDIFLKIFDEKSRIKNLFHLQLKLKGLFKIKKFYPHKKIIQDEYIYLINQNIMITINLTRNLKNKYLGIKITSYIKKK